MISKFPLSKNSISALAIALSVVTFGSCKKDDSGTPTTTPVAQSVNETEAAELVKNVLSGNSGGFATQATFAATIAATLPCNQQQSSSYKGKSGAGAKTTFDYELQWAQKTTCASLLPSSYEADFQGKTNYTSDKISSTDNTTAHFALAGMGLTDAEYVINESYQRSGTQTVNIDKQQSISSTVSVSGTNIKVNKMTRKITSGTATVSISGMNDGKAFNYNATVTFTGNNQATISFNGGGTHTADL